MTYNHRDYMCEWARKARAGGKIKPVPPERARQYRKKYRVKAATKLDKAQRKRADLRNPLLRPKILARAAFHWAIRSGRLKRQPCELCKKPNAQGHHHDYAKPFDVTWLCPEHHRERHKIIGDFRKEREIEEGKP